MPIVRILAISGSLRAASLNSTLLRAVAGLAPADVRFELFTEPGALPLFNPDLEITDLAPVALFHARLVEAVATALSIISMNPGLRPTLPCQHQFVKR